MKYYYYPDRGQVGDYVANSVAVNAGLYNINFDFFGTQDCLFLPILSIGINNNIIAFPKTISINYNSILVSTYAGILDYILIRYNTSYAKDYRAGSNYITEEGEYYINFDGLGTTNYFLFVYCVGDNGEISFPYIVNKLEDKFSLITKAGIVYWLAIKINNNMMIDTDIITIEEGGKEEHRKGEGEEINEIVIYKSNDKDVVVFAFCLNEDGMIMFPELLAKNRYFVKFKKCGNELHYMLIPYV